MKQLLSHKGRSLAKLFQKVKIHEQMDNDVKSHLPIELHAHCRVTDYQQGRLVITVDNAHWATHLRFYETLLLDALRKNKRFHHLALIKLRVSTESHSKPLPMKQPLTLTVTAAKHISHTADDIQHEKLKSALEKLAKRGKD